MMHAIVARCMAATPDAQTSANRFGSPQPLHQDAPTLTPSMRIAMSDLRLDTLFVIYPGRKQYTLADRIEVLPASLVAEFKSTQ